MLLAARELHFTLPPQILMMFNMHTTPARIFDRLMDFCDASGDGVDYAEFAQLLSADTKDVVKKLGVERKVWSFSIVVV